ncbi:unnamed protein product [Effrenium voratum]|nr:unnamed protein product [Effrenium voratum]
MAEGGERPQAPHEVGGEAVDYRLVIPTRGRWRAACKITAERALKKEDRPFILVKTLAFLKRQRIPSHRVTLYVADEDERQRYQEALQRDEFWADTALQVGVPGILAQRNHIVKSMDEGTYVVSFDDDVSEICWYTPGSAALTPLPDGTLESLIFHAHGQLKRHRAYIWGLNPSMNVRNLWSDGISCRNGEINGFCYGFLNRHKEALLPVVSDTAEDAERSLRFFKEDKVVLRYRMYTGITRCFGYEEGLQKLFEGASLRERKQARKAAEELAFEQLRKLFPGQLMARRQRKTLATLAVAFRPLGGPPVPVTSVPALRQANKADSKHKGAQGAAKPVKKRKSSTLHFPSEGPSEPEQSQEEPKEAPSAILVESGSSDELSTERGEQADENGSLESALARHAGTEEEALFAALEESRKSLDYLAWELNGSVADPMEEARARSLKEATAALREDAEMKEAIRQSEEQSPASKGIAPDAAPASASEASADLALAQLVDMGFDAHAAQRALEHGGFRLAAS